MPKVISRIIVWSLVWPISAWASHVPNQAPEADAGGPYTFECSEVQTAVGALDASNTHDHEGDPLFLLWTFDCPVSRDGNHLS